MKKLLALSLFIALTMVALSTVVKHEHIPFDHNSAYLSKSSRQVLETLIPDEPGWLVEKIDIEGHCDVSGGSNYNRELSRERAMRVYNFLTEHFPDKGDYELRHVGEDRPVNFEDPEINRCVLVSVYLLEIRGVTGTVSKHSLFPEEFPDFAELDDPVLLGQPFAQPEAQREPSFIPAEFETNSKFEIENIHFYGNSAVYRDESESSLGELTHFMKHNESVNIRIEGHVNGNMGKRYLKKAAETNPERTSYKNATDLSYERANTIKRFLVNEGIDEARIICEGKGGSEKLYKNPKNQAENRANRRIEVVILNK